MNELNSNTYAYHVVEIHELTEHISQILLQPESAHTLSYIAGQYVNVIHDKLSSPLSIACAPNANKTLEFHLYHSPENDKANELLRIATEKRVWKLQGPFGVCTSDRLQIDKPIIFLAYNTGFAPIKAVIEKLSQATVCPRIHLYWSVPRHHHFYLQSLLREWETELNFKFTLVVRNKAVLENKQLHELAVIDHPALSKYQAYVSGPKPFVYAALDAFIQQGLPRADFYSDMV